MVECNTELISKCKRIMSEQNINQVELSKKARVNPSSISLFLRGKSGLSKKHMTALEAYVRTYYHVDNIDNTQQVEVVEAVIVESNENRYEQYGDMTVEELDDLIDKLTTIRNNKIKLKINEVENEILRLYEVQERYNKLLKEN